MTRVNDELLNLSTLRNGEERNKAVHGRSFRSYEGVSQGVSSLHSAELEQLQWNEAIRGRSFHFNLFSGVCVHSNYKKKKLE